MAQAARSLWRQAAALAGAALFGGCAGLSDASSSSGDAAERLARLVEADARVATVFHRLIAANVDICPVRGVAPGWSLHAASQYGPDLRPLAEGLHGLDRDLPGILAVAPNGPAARAGLAPGDLITAVDGQALSAGDATARPSYDGLAANLRTLDAAFRRGPATLDVLRGGRAISVRVEPEPVCGYSVHVEPGSARNARSDGSGVFISAGLAGFAADDADLALVLGHELAHAVLQHRLPGGALTAAGRAGDAEREADRIGLCLARRAGYATDGAAAFWRRFGAADWRARYPQLGHPSAEARARALEAAAAELAAAGEQGCRLPPSPVPAPVPSLTATAAGALRE